MEEYKEIIHRLIELCQAAAKLTGNTWDDQVASVAHEVFDRWFGIVHGVKSRPEAFGAADVESRFNLTDPEVKKLPAWLTTLLLRLIQVLPLFV
jgi:hypothetical protein